jgi:acetyl/propionyl-CoA carboxylase alpha subunit
VKSLRAQEGCESEAVALYTEIDRDAPFVRHADAAVLLDAPAGAAVRAYLDRESLLSVQGGEEILATVRECIDR